MKLTKQHAGATLIEIIITVLLLSTCLLSMGIMQKRSLQFNQSAFMRSQANIYVYDILDRIRLNKKDIASYNVAYGGSVTGTTVAATDMIAWRDNIKRYLPDGDGAIVCNSTTNSCQISVRWSEEQMFSRKAGDTTACSSVSESCAELIYTSVM